MSREWKPGQVAMVAGPDGVRRAVRRGGVWMNLDSEGYVIDAYVENVFPLVVIDPEDREQMRRIAECAADGDAAEWRIDMWQRYFRGLADPKLPKPEEPMGLGAVVEDAAGSRWIAHEPDGGMGANAYRWLQAGSTVGKMRRPFSDIDAVRVLSEGVR